MLVEASYSKKAENDRTALSVKNQVNTDKMNFERYTSIQNANKIDPLYRHEGDYVATEKVHGANFSIHAFPNGDIKFGKRSAFLRDLPFNNHIEVVQNIKEQITQIIIEARKALTSEGVVRIYAEIFGGVYDGSSHHKPVQKEVEYCPDIHLYLFDIVVDGVFLPYNVFEKICKNVAVLYSKPLHKGSLDELLKLDPGFATTIPALLGLKRTSKHEENVAEGYVIKPFDSVYDNRGNRIIYKLKSKMFCEKALRKAPEVSNAPEDIKEMYTDIYPLLCNNRISNILSHGDIEGEMKPQLKKRILIGMLIRDAINESNHSGITKSKRKRIVALLEKEAYKIVDDYFD